MCRGSFWGVAICHARWHREGLLASYESRFLTCTFVRFARSAFTNLVEGVFSVTQWVVPTPYTMTRGYLPHALGAPASCTPGDRAEPDRHDLDPCQYHSKEEIESPLTR